LVGLSRIVFGGGGTNKKPQKGGKPQNMPQVGTAIAPRPNEGGGTEKDGGKRGGSHSYFRWQGQKEVVCAPLMDEHATPGVGGLERPGERGKKGRSRALHAKVEKAGEKRSPKNAVGSRFVADRTGGKRRPPDDGRRQSPLGVVTESSKGGYKQRPNESTVHLPDGNTVKKVIRAREKKARGLLAPNKKRDKKGNKTTPGQQIPSGTKFAFRMGISVEKKTEKEKESLW